jgi:hypothetical protein
MQLLELGHSAGQLLHYGADAQLRELVIREPQWLLDAICCIVRQFRIHVGPFDAKAQRIVPDSWDDLTTKGLLRESLCHTLGRTLCQCARHTLSVAAPARLRTLVPENCELYRICEYISRRRSERLVPVCVQFVARQVLCPQRFQMLAFPHHFLP